jgi:hypothetical protein
VADGACRPLFAFHDQGFQYVAPCTDLLRAGQDCTAKSPPPKGCTPYATVSSGWRLPSSYGVFPESTIPGNGVTTFLDDGIRNRVAADVMLARIAHVSMGSA